MGTLELVHIVIIAVVSDMVYRILEPDVIGIIVHCIELSIMHPKKESYYDIDIVDIKREKWGFEVIYYCHGCKQLIRQSIREKRIREVIDLSGDSDENNQ